MLGMFHNFHESARFDHRFMESFISLILKIKELVFLNDFCPISLLGWVHKLVARVLTARLCSMIDQVISHTHTKFI